MSRLPPPPAARMGSILRSAGVASRAMPEPSAPSVGTAAVSPGDIEAAVAAGVTRAITDLVASGVLVPAGAVAARPTAAPASAPAAVVDASDPVYIPTNIVPADGVPSITVAQSSSGGSDIDAAAAALKATRRRKSTEPK